MWLIASVSKIENESLVCEQSQQKGRWMVEWSWKDVGRGEEGTLATISIVQPSRAKGKGVRVVRQSEWQQCGSGS